MLKLYMLNVTLFDLILGIKLLVIVKKLKPPEVHRAGINLTRTIYCFYGGYYYFLSSNRESL